MPRGMWRLLSVTTLLVCACGSDPETSPTVPNPPDSAPPADAPSSRDTSLSGDTAVTGDAAMTAEDGASSRMDGANGRSDVLDARAEAPDVSSGDADSGQPPAPTDATSEDGSGPPGADAAVGDAIAAPDTPGDGARITDGGIEAADDAADTADATGDVADVAIGADVGSAADATGDQAGDACTSEACGASGFPGSALVDAAQGAMINGWVGTPTQLWKLCYSTALHQRSGAAFHTNCAYKGPSVSIARVSFSTETRVIGGYNSGSWTIPASSTYSNFSGSFLFSVTNSFKHDYPGSSAVPYYVLQNANYGPTFGAGNDWYVHSQFTMGTCRPGYTYQCRIGTLDSATCNVDFCGTPSSSDYYVLEELEVWIR